MKAKRSIFIVGQMQNKLAVFFCQNLIVSNLITKNYFYSFKIFVSKKDMRTLRDSGFCNADFEC